MRLCGAAQPVMHATNACALGFFDPRRSGFDFKTLEAAGIDPALLPRAAGDFAAAGEIRETRGNGPVPVAAAIGDNQAAFLGSVRAGGALVNIGTGGQISLTGGADGNSNGEKHQDAQGSLEQRPYFEGKSLYSGASLCGGKAYAMLEEFFRAVLRMAGVLDGVPLYGAMEDARREAATGEDAPGVCAGTKNAGETLLVNTMFEGSRRDPLLRGWIKNISPANFTPAALIRGFLEGMAGELYGMLPEAGSGGHSAAFSPEKITFLAGSGNGIRKNPFLRRVIEKKFALPLMMPLHEEEAAFGAALYALICAGRFRGTADAARLIKYQGETP
jgi:sedoheptulokinase